MVAQNRIKISEKLFIFLRRRLPEEGSTRKESSVTQLHRLDHHFTFEITDNGVGFNTQDISHANGLLNMHAGAENLHGKFTVLSSDEGTKVTLVFSA